MTSTGSAAFRAAKHSWASAATIERVLAAVAVATLGFGAALDVVTLTRTPEAFGDEAWTGSAVWSVLHGHPLRPAMALGAGIYDGTFDHWMPRLGIVPQLVAGLIGGTSFTVFRAASLVVTLTACGVLVRALQRRYGLAVGASAVAAILTTWIVFETSHYVRWDDVTFLWATIIVAVAMRGQPGPRTAAVLGAMLGFAPDFSVPLVALVPAAGLLIAWDPVGRRRRLGMFAGTVAAGLVVYLAIHFLPGISTARRQWNDVYAGAYKIPLLAALEQHSLHPIFAEHDRYTALALAPFRATRWTLYLAILSAVGVIVLRLRERQYPVRAVGSLFLLSQLIGLALLYANHAALYFIGAMPFAAVAFAEAVALASRRLPALAAAVAVMCALSLVGARAIVQAARYDARGAATNSRVSAIASTMVPKDGTAMGDYVYWWLFRDGRFRYNADIWFQELHDHLTFDQAFNRICPNVVVLDDFWFARYTYFGPNSLGRRFPGLAPTDQQEQGKLLRLLFREYEYPPRLVVAGGRAVELWRRRGSSCSASGAPQR